MTPKELCSVKYRDLDHAVQNSIALIREMKDLAERSETSQTLFYGKTDLKSAFRQAPLKEKMWKLLVLKAENPQTQQEMFFMDKCLPFGASISCAHFQRISNALKHIVEALERLFNTITNYLDDFLFIHYLCTFCDRLIRHFMQVCEQIRLPIADEKTETANIITTFLGMTLNRQKFTIAVTEEKRHKALHLLQFFGHNKKVQIKQIEQLMGTLNFLSHAIVPGRVFIRCMYAKLEGRMLGKNGKPFQQYHHVTLDKEFHNDCLMWTTFLLNQGAVNRSFDNFDTALEPIDVGFFSDSSKNEDLGFGCFFNKQWIFGQWEPGFIKENNPSIAYLELFTLCAGILTWRQRLSYQSILIHCDNIAVIHMVNKMTSSCKNCMYLLRILMLDNLLCHRKISVIYIETKQNLLADLLSRLKIGHFLQVASFGIKTAPEKLPKEIWPLSHI